MSFKRVVFCQMNMLHCSGVQNESNTIHGCAKLIDIPDVADHRPNPGGIEGLVHLQLVVLLFVAGVDEDFLGIGFIL